MKIYAYRFSAARGHRWVEERDCTAETADQWLAIFRADEPNIEFVAALRPPRMKK